MVSPVEGGHLLKKLRDVWARRLFFYADPMVLDRWRWIASHLPKSHAFVLDAGCGNGVIAASAGRLGHSVLGLTHSENDVDRCRRRNPYAHVTFDVQDLRFLGDRRDLYDRFDVVICTEVIEHVLDDVRLLRGIAKTLNSDGQLLLTTPNLDYRPLDGKEEGPYEPI